MRVSPCWVIEYGRLGAIGKKDIGNLSNLGYRSDKSIKFWGYKYGRTWRRDDSRDADKFPVLIWCCFAFAIFSRSRRTGAERHYIRPTLKPRLNRIRAKSPFRVTQI